MMRISGAAVAEGFTLLELLVALAIFGLLATMSYSGLQAVLQQQSYAEVAEAQGWSIEQVKTNVHRARKKVMTELQDLLRPDVERLS